jgi:hypothetical protein
MNFHDYDDDKSSVQCKDDSNFFPLPASKGRFGINLVL